RRDRTRLLTRVPCPRRPDRRYEVRGGTNCSSFWSRSCKCPQACAHLPAAPSVRANDQAQLGRTSLAALDKEASVDEPSFQSPFGRPSKQALSCSRALPNLRTPPQRLLWPSERSSRPYASAHANS